MTKKKSDNTDNRGSFYCPTANAQQGYINLAHGSGGQLSRQLIEQMILPAFCSGKPIDRNQDSTIVPTIHERLAFTTDSYVIKPLFFPGGDIGSLAVTGTVNDLAMRGAQARYLSLALIIEEGLAISTLDQVIQSAAATAKQAGAEIITGDTKVVDKGHGDGLYINTSGIGFLPAHTDIGVENIRHGDHIIVSGDLGRHGTSVICARQNMDLQTSITSDMACLNHLVAALQAAEIEIHCMRDLTRGGLATALLELTSASALGCEIEESEIPIESAVQSVCEILGFDPLYIANEGRMIVYLPEQHSQRALAIMKQHPLSCQAKIIGQVDQNHNQVTLNTRYGSRRTINPMIGDQLPRIC